MRSCSLWALAFAGAELDGADWVRWAGVQAYSLRGGLLSARRLESHCGRAVADDDPILICVNGRVRRNDDDKGERRLNHTAIDVVCAYGQVRVRC